MEIIIILFALAILGLLVFIAIRMKSAPGGTDSALMLQQQLENLRAQLADSLKYNTETVSRQLENITGQVQNSNKAVGERLDNAARVVSEVKKEIGSLSQASERIFEVGKDISSLQEILRAPKLRGGLGEFFLGDLLSQILPGANYKLQHKFRSGETVDAVIMIGNGLVPVDSKFPLENFKRVIEAQNDVDKKAAKKKFTTDVKKHIDDIAVKYILPDEKTFDFALMYIPAENIYYETIIKDEISQEENTISAYALSKKVIPVSPNSFYAYLQAIVLGLKGMRIEKNAEILMQHIARLKGDFAKFQGEFETLGGHLTNAKNKYEETSKRLEKFGDKLLSEGETGESKKLSE
ncbi:MAG: DNA recombination protein RmuC [Elusimicrobiota bacterium]